MFAEIEAQDFLLPSQLLTAFGYRKTADDDGLVGCCDRGCRFGLGEEIKEGCLAADAGASGLLSGADCGVQTGKERCTVTERVEGTGLDEAFEGPLVPLAKVQPTAQVGEVNERPVLFAFLDQAFNGCIANELHT